MHVAVDATTWWNRRGFGRFTRGLLSALLRRDDGHRYTLLTDRPFEVPPPGDTETVVVPTSAPARAGADSSRRLRDMLALTRAAGRARPDLLFYPAVYSFFPAPRGPRALVTFHDAIAELNDDVISRRAKHRLFWRMKVRLALLQADRLLCVSADARRQVVEAFGTDPARIDVCTEGPDPVFAPRELPRVSGGALSRHGVPDGLPFLLYVGGIAPHKNVRRLVRCFGADGVPGDAQLVLVGDTSADGFIENVGEIEADLASRPDLAARVHFTGFVPDDELAELYARATAFVIPSYAEGFGLCPIEAMACGTPVLASTGGSLPEVLGDAALSFDPRDDAALTRALADVLRDQALRSDLARRSLARARLYSWERGAELALASFARTVAS